MSIEELQLKFAENTNELKTIEPYVQTLQLSPQNEKHFYLVIGIGTIPRISDGQPLNYLEQTVRSLVNEIKVYKKSAKYKPERNIIIYVQSHVAGHAIFDKLRRDDELKDFAIFVDGSAHRFNDPFEDLPGHDYTACNNTLPGHLACQQNCDVISFSENAIHNLKFTHFLFMEDDFLICKNGIINLINALEVIDRNTAGKGYCGLNVGYGMSGIAMPREQLISFIKFAKAHIRRFEIIR